METIEILILQNNKRKGDEYMNGLIVITESEEGSITENTSNIVRARPIPGRTFSFGVKYNF